MIKAVLRSLDDLLLGGRAADAYRRRRTARAAENREEALRGARDALGRATTYSFTVYYDRDEGELLSSLCDRYGSDKGGKPTEGRPFPWIAHTFVDLYAALFHARRMDVRRVFECGIGTFNTDTPSNMGTGGMPGASLRVWRDYFPNAHIVGADVDRRILFQEDRIETRYVDQTDPTAIRELWRIAGPDRFDIMIDDGLHTFEAGRCLFENSAMMLAKEGVYVIEDVRTADMLRYRSYFSGQGWRVEYVMLRRPGCSLMDEDVNNLVVIRHYSRC